MHSARNDSPELPSRLREAVWATLGPVPTDRNVVLLADAGVPGGALRAILPPGGGHVVVRAGMDGPDGDNGPDWFCTRTPRINYLLPVEAARRVRGLGVSLAVVLPGHSEPGLRALAGWRRLGIRGVFRHDGSGWRQSSPKRECFRRIADSFRSGPRGARKTFAADITRDNALPAPDKAQGPLSIVHYIGSLWPGGAERQLCHTAVAQARAGHRVTVLCAGGLEGDAAHYRPILEQADIPCRRAGDGPVPCDAERAPGPVKHHLLSCAPKAARLQVYDLMLECACLRPDVLHCWLDWQNVAGGVAGYLAGVETIVLGVRNVNPSHFPRFHQSWFRPWYRVLRQSRRVALAANSRAGAEDYGRWLGMDKEGILPGVIPNSIDSEVLDRADGKSGFRKELGIGPDVPLLGGFFRLDQEKRPLDFLRVVRVLARIFPALRCVVAGIGSMEALMVREIGKLGLSSVVSLLGRRRDVERIMRECDAVLLASEWEGTPNVLLEAQALGVPVVATRAGGAPEVVLDGETGFLCPVGDIRCLAAHVGRLLESRSLARQMGGAGERFARERFSLAAQLERTVRLYGGVHG